MRRIHSSIRSNAPFGIRSPGAIHLAGILCVAALCFGGYGSGGGMRVGGGGGSGSSTPPPAPPPVDHTASNTARQGVNAASAEVAKAQHALEAVATRLRGGFEQQAEWQSAQKEARGAQAELEAVRQPILANLGGSAPYKAAVEAKQKAEADRDSLTAGATPEQWLKVVDAVLAASKAVQKLEADALAADPRVAAAQAKLAAANAKTAELLKTFNASLPSDAGWQAANQTVEEKKQALATARKTLADAIAQEAQARR